MKAGTLLMIIGVLIVVVVHIIGIIQNKFPTYSLFYLAGGILFGAGVATYMNG